MNNGFWKRVLQGFIILAAGAICTVAWSHENRISKNEGRYELIRESLKRIEDMVVDLGRKRR